MILSHPLVIGRSGQVGRAFQKLFDEKGIEYSLLSRAEADMSDLERLPHHLSHFHPSCVINAAAFTDVQGAETDFVTALKVNGNACGLLAQFAKSKDIPLISYSTDYVFGPENSTEPHLEDEPTHPVNAYGKSKLQGEMEIKKTGCKHLIFRTSWVYDESGKNFLNTMLRLGRQKEELKVVSDQIGAPTYALDIARATLEILEKPKLPNGIYNLTNSGFTSWHGFAAAIFNRAVDKGISIKVKNLVPISTKEFGGPVVRPLNSRLSLDKIGEVFGVKMRSWEEALSECMERVV